VLRKTLRTSTDNADAGSVRGAISIHGPRSISPRLGSTVRFSFEPGAPLEYEPSIPGRTGPRRSRRHRAPATIAQGLPSRFTARHPRALSRNPPARHAHTVRRRAEPAADGL